MQFLSMRELSKAPKAAFSRLAKEGKAVITNNGKPAAFMINIDAGNFERMFALIQEIEKMQTPVIDNNIRTATSDRERAEAFDRLINYPRAKLPSSRDSSGRIAEKT